MDTDSTWFAVLVIILSTFLAIFLALAIVLIAKVISIVNKVKHIVDIAEEVADRAENISGFFKKTSAPVAIFKLIGNISDVIKKEKKK